MLFQARLPFCSPKDNSSGPNSKLGLSRVEGFRRGVSHQLREFHVLESDDPSIPGLPYHLGLGFRV